VISNSSLRRSRRRVAAAIVPASKSRDGSAFCAAMRSPGSSRLDMAPGSVFWLRLMRARVFPMRVLV
jgi:hypothetical protein